MAAVSKAFTGAILSWTGLLIISVGMMLRHLPQAYVTMALIGFAVSVLACVYHFRKPRTEKGISYSGMSRGEKTVLIPMMIVTLAIITTNLWSIFRSN